LWDLRKLLWDFSIKLVLYIYKKSLKISSNILKGIEIKNCGSESAHQNADPNSNKKLNKIFFENKGFFGQIFVEKSNKTLFQLANFNYFFAQT
jgi:hypothetical protein